MSKAPTIDEITLTNLDSVVLLFAEKEIDLAKAGVRTQGMNPFTNGNKVLGNCGAFVVSGTRKGKKDVADEAVTLVIEAGGTITFFRPPTYDGAEALCLIEDKVGERLFAVKGTLSCTVRAGRPWKPSVQTRPLPVRAFSY